MNILSTIAIVLSVIAIIEAIWSPRLQTVKVDEFDVPQVWLFYNKRKRADKLRRRKGVQVL